MSNAVLTRVWTQSKQIKNHRLLLVALADGVNDHGVGFHGIEFLAEKVLLSERQTRRIRDDLEASGEIYVQLGNGRGNKTQYLVCTGLDASEIQTSLAMYFEMDMPTAENVTLSIVEKRGTFFNSLTKRGTKSNIKGDKKRVKGDMVKRKTPTTINHKNHIPKQKVSGDVSKPRKRDLLFDVIALESFHVSEVPQKLGGRVASVKRDLLALCKPTPEELERLPDELTAMYAWYKKGHRGIDVPAGAMTIYKYLIEYRATLRPVKPPEKYTIVEPEIYQSETEAA